MVVETETMLAPRTILQISPASVHATSASETERAADAVDWTQYLTGFTPEELDRHLRSLAENRGIACFEGGVAGLVDEISLRDQGGQDGVKSIVEELYQLDVRAGDLYDPERSMVTLTAASSSTRGTRMRLMEDLEEYAVPYNGDFHFVDGGAGLGADLVDIEFEDGEVLRGVYSTMRGKLGEGARIRYTLIEPNLIGTIAGGLEAAYIQRQDPSFQYDVVWGAMPDALGQTDLEGAFVSSNKVTMAYFPRDSRQAVVDTVAAGEVQFFFEAGQMKPHHPYLHFLGVPFRPGEIPVFIPGMGIWLERKLFYDRGRLRVLLDVMKKFEGKYPPEAEVVGAYDKAGMVRVGDPKREDVYYKSGLLPKLLGPEAHSSRTVVAFLTRPRDSRLPVEEG